jgi:hypothetical protein
MTTVVVPDEIEPKKRAGNKSQPITQYIKVEIRIIPKTRTRIVNLIALPKFLTAPSRVKENPLSRRIMIIVIVETRGIYVMKID